MEFVKIETEKATIVVVEMPTCRGESILTNLRVKGQLGWKMFKGFRNFGPVRHVTGDQWARVLPKFRGFYHHYIEGDEYPFTEDRMDPLDLGLNLLASNNVVMWNPYLFVKFK